VLRTPFVMRNTDLADQLRHCAEQQQLANNYQRPKPLSAEPSPPRGDLHQ
jgi:hypothetical protein